MPAPTLTGSPSARPVPSVAVPARIDRFLADHGDLPTPFLVLDLDVVGERYATLRAALPCAAVFYAVKANPAPEVIRTLHDLGSNFDVASVGEVELCLRLGVGPPRLSYGNTIKKERDIAAAYALGVRTFTVDSLPELHKVQAVCAEATVLVRLATGGTGADWPLSRKFGCTPAEAEVMLLEAGESGYELGLSFHVGSQQHDPAAWYEPLRVVADLATTLAGYGHRLAVVNLGGGLPSTHHAPTAPVERYGEQIEHAVHEVLGTQPGLRYMVEPGRFLVGDAGLIRSEVVLVADKAADAGRRWVYLDLGVFNGLTETQEEAIRYRLRCPDAVAAAVPCVLAGPTCDSLDILYERQLYPLPADLAAGQVVDVLSTGAYTSSYSSVWFNGFEPLPTYVLPVTTTAPARSVDQGAVHELSQLRP